MGNRFIIGSGGGKGGGSTHVAVEDPDSLRSSAYARVLDLVSEGEIDGLVHGFQSVFLDDTPLQNPDGSYNFTGVQVETRNGTQGQTHISLTEGAEFETAVGIEVKYGNPIERTITNPDADWARITIGIPALSRQDTSTGDLHGASVSYRVEVSAAGGTYKPVMLSIVPKYFGWNWYTAAASNDTAAAATGFSCAVRWTPNYLTASWRKKPVTATFRVEYRKKGTTTWSSAGEQTFTANVQTVTTEVGPSDFGFSGNTYPTYQTTNEWPTELSIGAFNVTGLEPAVYETRVVCVSTTEPSHGGSQIAAGTAYVQSAPAVITGKTSSRYQRSHIIKLSQFGCAPWIIRVSRETQDSTSSALQNKTWWDSLTTVIDEKLSYPLSALVGLRVAAEQFQSVPRRGYDIKGIKVKIPSNYNPLTRVYTGSWDGTFIVAWTDNPAWIFFDLCTNARYGVGDYVPASLLDKWSLYAIAQYCDELVPDGNGGWEPRYTCNIYLQTRQDAYRVLTDIASVFRGMTYWSAGGIVPVCDKPSNPVYQYTAANVIDGLFTYSGANQKARHNVAYVTWNDPSDMYRQKVEYVADESLITSWGYVNQTDVVAVGCTSRGQARRVGEWIIYTERFENETVTFATGLEGNIPRPGDVIQISDVTRAGERRGGRLLGATSNTVALDASVTISAGQTYQITIVKSDGSLETKTVTTGAGTTSSLTISGSFTSTPATGTIWILSSTNVQPELYRVIHIAEQEQGTQFAITALKHYPTKYAYIEHDRDFQQPDTSSTPDPFQSPPDVYGVQLSESLYRAGQAIMVKLAVSWEALPDRFAISGYRLEYRITGGNWIALTRSTSSTAEIQAVQEGADYEVRIISINALGRETSNPTVYTRTILGKAAPPGNVTGFVVARQNDGLNFRWNVVDELDVVGYELRTGTMWDAAAVVGTTAGTSFSYSSTRGGTFMVKAYDSSGVYSDSASLVSVADLSGINVTVEYNEETGGWNGTKSNVEAVVTSRKSEWADATNWSALSAWGQDTVSGGIVPVGTGANWTALDRTWEAYTKPWAFLLPPDATGGQYVTEVIDISYIAQCGIQIYPKVEILRSTELIPWSEYTLPWSAYTDPWAEVPAEIDPVISLAYEISTSEDGVGWTDYQQYTPGIYQFRYVRFRITMASADATSYLPMLTGFRVSIDVPDRVVHFEDQSIPIGGKTFTFSPAFVDIATVQVTLQGGAIGDTYKVTGKSNTSVTVNVYDNTGAAKTGLADIDVFGYGNRL